MRECSGIFPQWNNQRSLVCYRLRCIKCSSGLSFERLYRNIRRRSNHDMTFSLPYQRIDHIAFTGNSYNFAGTNLPVMDNLLFTSHSVPEPTSITLLGLGFAILGFVRRKKI